MTPDGPKPIEELKVGDEVLARNEHNVEGGIQPKRIEETFDGETHLLELRLQGQQIRTTKDHRFFVKDRGWTPAEDLKVGDLLVGSDSNFVELEAVSESSESERVYNFRVADYHTYFVGRPEWGFAVWTHNDYGGPAFNANRPFHFFIRDNTTSALLFMGRVDDPTQLDNELTPSVARIPGDSNGDGVFNSTDFLRVFQIGKYEDGIPSNATFDEGDWNGDGDFDSADLVHAFQAGHYSRSAESAAAIAAAVDWLFDEEDSSSRKPQRLA